MVIIKKVGFVFLMLFFNLNSAFTANLTDDYLKSNPQGNSLDKKRWEKLKDDYKYKTIKIDTTQKTKINTPSVFGDSGWFKVMVWLAIIVLVGLIIYLLARLGFLDKKSLQKKVLFDINKEPDDINNLEIDPLLAAALKNKDYKLATRLRFLTLLQLLNKRKLIQWKRDKTNRDYIHQLRENDIYSSFGEVCHIYESVWYGNYPISEKQYDIVSEKFTHILSLISSKVYA